MTENSIRLFSWKPAVGSEKNNPSEEKIFLSPTLILSVFLGMQELSGRHLIVPPHATATLRKSRVIGELHTPAHTHTRRERVCAESAVRARNRGARLPRDLSSPRASSEMLN